MQVKTVPGIVALDKPSAGFLFDIAVPIAVAARQHPTHTYPPFLISTDEGSCAGAVAGFCSN